VARYGFISDFGRAVFFIDFLRNADPRNISEIEILMLLAFCGDAVPVYIPLKKKERGYGGYQQELRQVIHESMEENKPVFQSVWKITGMLAQEKEREIKKALMMSRWISKAETKEIENSYEVFSGALKWVGEDFSWLAETLASLAREIRWDPKAIEKISALSQRLIYGVTETCNVRVMNREAALSRRRPHRDKAHTALKAVVP
jgi:replicative superfamily II helicase